jgi:hypothetical protein
VAAACMLPKALSLRGCRCWHRDLELYTVSLFCQMAPSCLLYSTLLPVVVLLANISPAFSTIAVTASAFGAL